MRQIWARRRLLPDESGVPVAVARRTLLGVRPSSGTAKVGTVNAPELAKTFVLINAAAPGDGRTPVGSIFP